jgi:hypothetical protein
MGRPKAQFCKHGHDTNICGRDSTNACNDCKRDWTLDNPEYAKEYHEKNRDVQLEKQKKYREENKDILAIKQKEFWDAHRDLKRQKDKEYYEKNKIRLLALMREWAKTHRDITRALKIKSQTNRNLRVVAWTDWDRIKEIYANCPEGMEVDHIIPLQGKNVSGLHVSWNLQYLMPAVNRSKGNKIDLL